jgi:transcriptional regulator with XRE-family HTH domain
METPISNEERFLALFRMEMARRKIKQKNLARKFRKSRSYVSLWLNGELRMPPEIKQRFIKELGLEDVILSLGLDFTAAPKVALAEQPNEPDNGERVGK